MPIRRACRSSSLKGVARNTSTKRVISSTVCIRPPTAITCASLCWRARTAVSSDHTSAQRMPATLLAAICSPLPEPPMTTPRLPRLGGHGLGRAQAEDGIVVERVVDEGTVVDRLVAVLGQPGRQVGLEVETGVVAAEVHAHGRGV